MLYICSAWICRVLKSEYQNAENHNQIENDKAYGAVKVFVISWANAFTEEHAMVVIAGDTYVTGAAVVHVFAYINIAFDAIEYFYFIAVSVFPLLILGPIP